MKPLLTTTAVRPLPSRLFDSPDTAERREGRFWLQRSPWWLARVEGRWAAVTKPRLAMPVETWVAIRASMVRAAYQGRIRPHGAVEGDIGFDDLDVKEHPERYPPEYRALVGQIEAEAGGV